MQMQESKIDTGKALDADLVDTESIRTDSIVQDDNSMSGNDTDADDADIRPIYNEEPMAEVQLTAEYFSRMEAHCIALELKYQNQALKLGQHGQILNETSNKAKIEKEIDVLETMNIELEHSVAKLRKENETLKQHYKDLYDSIKITRSKTTEQTTSLLANNAELKAQIQEKVFAIAALKNDLRKLKGNSVDTKFDKTSVLGKPVIPSLRNQSVVRQPNAFKSERAQMSKQQFASQVDVNKNLNSSKNMPRFSSNDMVHNHYLDVAKKKIQERDRNSTTSVTTSARIQTTADDSKPKPRSNNQTSRSLPVSKSSRVTITVVPKADHSKSSSSFSDSKQFVCSTCHKCVFNANHDACITKLLKEVNSRAKIQSYKTRNSNKPVDQKSHTQKPGRQILKGHRFSPNKTSAVYEKTSPRSDLRWKTTGRIFKSVGLRWIPTGKLFDSCTSKIDSEPPHGSNVDIPNIHECIKIGFKCMYINQCSEETKSYAFELVILGQGENSLNYCSMVSLLTTIKWDKTDGVAQPNSSEVGFTKPHAQNSNFQRTNRDCYARKLIQMVKIHTDHNVDAGRHVKRGRDTKIPQSSGPPIKVSDEVVHKELGDRMERAATTASSLEAEQDSDAQTRFETTFKKSNDPPLSRGYTLGSGEDSMKLLELMELCIKLLDLATTKAKTVNGEHQLQALVDKKKVIITETSIRSDLHLEDASGIDCLPTATIFEELARIGAKTTAWNEFNSTMAFAIICLATD
ncbi:hypothetical protein Tco_1054964 [Tanacetum coccineum]|uniref:Uncharacterized protein n=1 Tax=Tanacetum coccineum TaxID=301880 RepID=A0ABQ5H057_9ASTR